MMEVESQIDARESSRFPYAMLREIYEQPAALEATIERYRPGAANAETLEPMLAAIGDRERLVIAASGSSRHAGLVGEIAIEDLAGVPVDVEYASEYTYRSSQPVKDAGVIVISQSGETADTLAALREARSRELPAVAITNSPRSSMALEASASLPTLAGREAAIPATKSFTTQLAVLQCIALHLAHRRGRMTQSTAEAYGEQMQQLPGLLEAALSGWQRQMEALAPSLVDSSTLIYLGRGAHYAIAREGALKLKESAYMNAEGYPSGEFKHGPNALVSRETPLIMLATAATQDPGSMLRYGKVVQLMRDMKAQGARIIALVSEGDEEASEHAEECVLIPQTSDLLASILEVVPLQLLAYVLALQKGIDVDRPRNLVKSVTRE